jgi:hypothetical protein
MAKVHLFSISLFVIAAAKMFILKWEHMDRSAFQEHLWNKLSFFIWNENRTQQQKNEEHYLICGEWVLCVCVVNLTWLEWFNRLSIMERW